MTNESDSSRQRAKVVILICKQSEQEVRRILANHAHSQWDTNSQIKLLVRPDNLWRHATENAELLKKVAPLEEAARIIVVGKIEGVDQVGKIGDYRSKNQFSDIRSFEKGILPILEQSNLDWKSFITRKLRSWNHSIISDSTVDVWLAQFQRLGVRWIGEYLLKNLEFWTPDELKYSLNLSSTSLGDSKCVCVKRKHVGKSGDFLANLFRKHLNSIGLSTPIFDFSEALNGNLHNGGKILFIEDCLLTGTEITNYLSGLMNLTHPSGRSWSTFPLEKPASIRECDIEMRFAVRTSLGIHRLHEFIRINELENISIINEYDGFIEVLTTEGQKALEDSEFFNPSINNCPINPDHHIDRVVFRSALNREQKKGEAVESFCRTIGEQLFDSYLKKKSQTWNEWPIEKAKIAGMGMHGLGLSLAFSHSIPKATLPLYWAGGLVTYKGKTFEWTPLFEGGEL